MKQKKTISSWLTSRFLLIIRDEENFAEKATIKFTYAKLFLGVSLIFIFFLSLSWLSVTTFLNKWFDPRTDYLRVDKTLIEMEEKVDSIIIEVEKKDQYIANLRNVLSGEVDFAVFENLSDFDSISSTNINLTQISPIDSQFRAEFEEADYEQLLYLNSAKNSLQDFFFFSPIDGVISKPYNVKEGHFGLDIVAKKNEPVKSIADGTVVISSWTQDSGHVLAIQHKHELISFYKHNSARLKNVGETVKAGDIIAIIGNSGELTDGPHLHFELWHNRNPVNPEDFISF
ncbi:M23 family metallopeptidase [Flexithrix dorotheae]|uniref:M23 family metallopeptidase n=1 Tax=Flexithrix dorotheae TaxID=70993 RepID=UPI0003687BD1|nr:M23 family metallopeptidase [Flexithrix dorotheae]